MKPARHTSSTPNSSSTRSMVPSNSARLPYSLWSTTWLDKQIRKLSLHNAPFDSDYNYHYIIISLLVSGCQPAMLSSGPELQACWR